MIYRDFLKKDLTFLLNYYYNLLLKKINLKFLNKINKIKNKGKFSKLNKILAKIKTCLNEKLNNENFRG
ncbi:50S ribosomal protein L29 [Candidatus Nasuia deltocephalinicola]|nr:50S ribosomal protein L29 [Candidatus Nasuia deltocephalinicola]